MDEKPFWMIERVIDGHHWWWARKPGCQSYWTQDANEARRFEYRIEAEYVQGRDMPDATITEHLFIDAAEVTAVQKGKAMNCPKCGSPKSRVSTWGKMTFECGSEAKDESFLFQTTPCTLRQLRRAGDELANKAIAIADLLGITTVARNVLLEAAQKWKEACNET